MSNTETTHLVCHESQDDPVNHPSHYTCSGIEVIDAIEAWELGFHAGNVVKYVARHKHKGKPLEDLQKAKWYLDRLIERTKECGNNEDSNH